MENPHINISVKLIIFTVAENKLKILLQDNILPDSILSSHESLDDCTKRIFASTIKLKLKDYYQEQLYTYSNSDKKLCKITVSYFILMPEHVVSHTQKKEWLSYAEIGKDLSDYEVIKYAVTRLRAKVEYTNIVYSLLPYEFTFGKLQKTYEAVLGRGLDKRNFRKKILSLNILKPTGKKQKHGQARPAEMFTFKKREATFVEIL